ncbi:MAG: MFS transporter [Halioglobus sp.]|nr:MFS transporter [Halioglobus sp.]
MKTQRFFLGWWILAIAFFVQMVGAGTILFSYSVIAVPLGTEFQASRLAMMFGITAMSLSGALISPLLGRALDRHSIRLLMVVAALILPLGYLLLSFVTNMWHVPVIYAACMSVGTLILGPLAASTLLARWFQSKLGLAMGIAAVGTSLGGFIFPPLIEWMIGAYGWRTAFRLLALLILVLTLPAALLVVNHPKDRGMRAYGASDGAASSAGAGVYSSLSILKSRNFWLVAAVISVLFAVNMALLTNLMPLAIDAGVTREQGALLISILAASGVVGKLIFGVIADRIDLRAGLAVAILLLITGLGFFLGESFTILVAGSVATGLATGGMLPVWGAMLAWLFGAENYGRVMGQMNPVIIPIYLVAPALAGAIYDRTGNYDTAFTLFIALLALSLLLLPAIRQSEQPETAA